MNKKFYEILFDPKMPQLICSCWHSYRCYQDIESLVKMLKSMEKETFLVLKMIEN